ncbi:hypothetical protein AK830_g8771 [Neonectria ditissima]|uniref:Protein kinase domain-containing protein n=1 Tax=Neonectria ditissima TaxID=78410 RepID=A0A0P7BBG4_9HYPO|nr:hypothetical protein AK830_g8771 [Neonectria ditissima]
MSAMAETETMDDIAVNQLHAGDGDGAGMVFAFNGRQISVSIFPGNGSSTKDSRHLEPEHRPLQDHLIDLLARAVVCEDDSEYEELGDEVLGVILNAGKSFFSQLTPSQGAPTRDHPSLHVLLFPEIIYFRLEAGAGHASIIPTASSEAYTALVIDPVLDGTFEEELNIHEHLPRYIPEKIVVTDVFSRGTSFVTAAVLVDGQDMFCKSRGRPGGLLGTSEGRELECLGKILTAFPQQDTIRVPKLLGYIHHQDTKQVLGFLRQWVPGRRLSEMDIATTTAETRQKWVLQMRESIRDLHKEGVIWGDGKPSNIIIDDQDDAWLIDFGRGYTEDWVDKELTETTEGDEQALAKIVKLLGAGGGTVSSP